MNGTFLGSNFQLRWYTTAFIVFTTFI